MSAGQEALAEKVEQLSNEVKALSLRLAALESHYGPALTAPAAPPGIAPSKPLPAAIDLGEPADISEEVISWAGKAALLPRLATFCFLMVIALILRTITDSELINTLIGSALGMGYAAALMLAGWFQYRRNSQLAPVFAACGAVLMPVIVVETHARFMSLPLVPAYLTLMATAIGMAIISRQFSVFLPVSVGTLGMCLAAAAIDYPNPFFPYLSMVLLAANLLGYYAATLKRCSWLRWIVFIVTLIMLQLWGMRLGLAIGRHLPTDTLALPWYLPVLALFAITFSLLALRGIVRSGHELVARFDFALPTISVTVIYLSARYVISADKNTTIILGVIGLAYALAMGSAGYWLVKRRKYGSPGTNAFIFAAAVLLALALPNAVNSLLIALPFSAVIAILLGIFSRYWQSGSVRLTSYLLQIYGAIALGIFFTGVKPDEPSSITGILTAAFVAAVTMEHYRWCRKNPPPTNTNDIFSRFDEHDLSAVSLLVSSLICAFFALRNTLYQFLLLQPANLANAYKCGQSVLINLSAIVLGLYAFRSRNKEIRNVALLVTATGAVKVFLYDLLGTKGVPLVLSVFSFGLAAAVLSIVLGRWQRGKSGEQPPQPPEASSSANVE